MERDLPVAVRRANQLQSFQQPLRVVEVAVREHEGLDLPEVQVHGPRVPLHGVRIRARIEQHALRCPIEMSGDGKAQPVMRGAERLAGQFLHTRLPQHAQLRRHVGGATREHVRCVVHHDVDGQLVYLPHTSASCTQPRRFRVGLATRLASGATASSISMS